MADPDFVTIRYGGHLRAAEFCTYTCQAQAFAGLALLDDINPMAAQAMRESYSSVIAAIAAEPDDLSLGQSPQAGNVRPFLTALWRAINASLPAALYWGWATEHTYRNDVGVWYKEPIWPSTGKYAYRQDDPDDELHRLTVYGPRPDYGDRWVMGHPYPAVRVPIVSMPFCALAENHEEVSS